MNDVSDVMYIIVRVLQQHMFTKYCTVDLYMSNVSRSVLHCIHMWVVLTSTIV
jgi:hypothetical protein